MGDTIRAPEEQVFFEDVAEDQLLLTREFGPHTIVDAVRWAGLQENWQHLHYDRDHVREHNGLPGFIASGAYRQALLIRAITDWVGPRGGLRQLKVRHVASTFEGDLMRFAVRAARKETDSGQGLVRCEVEGRNQEDRQVLVGTCTLTLPLRP